MKIPVKKLQDIIEEETKIVLNKKLKELVQPGSEDQFADPKDPATFKRPDGTLRMIPVTTPKDQRPTAPMDVDDTAAQLAGYRPRRGPLSSLMAAVDAEKEAAKTKSGETVSSPDVELSSPGELSLDMPKLPDPSVAKKGAVKQKRVRGGGRGAYNSQDSQVTRDIQQLLGINDDGIYGPETTRTVKQYFASRGESVPTGPTFSAAIAAQLAAIRKGGGKGKSAQGTGGGESGGSQGQGEKESSAEGWGSMNSTQLAQLTDNVIDDLDFPATVEGIQKAAAKISGLARKAVPNADGTKFYPAIFLFLRDYEQNQNFGESFEDVIAYLKGDSTLLRDVSKIGSAMGIGDTDTKGQGLAGHAGDTAAAIGAAGVADKFLPRAGKMGAVRNVAAQIGGKSGYRAAVGSVGRMAARTGAKMAAKRAAGAALALAGPVGWAVGVGSIANDLFGNKIGAMLRGGTGKAAVESLESIVNQLKSEGNQWISNNPKSVDAEMHSQLGEYAAEASISDMKVPNEKTVPNEKPVPNEKGAEGSSTQSQLKPGDEGYGVMKEGNYKIKVSKNYFEKVIKEELRNVLKI